MDVFPVARQTPCGQKALIAAIEVSLSIGASCGREIIGKIRDRTVLTVALDALSCNYRHDIASEINGSPPGGAQGKLD